VFCNVGAVNQSSNLIVGSQPFWFEKSRPVGQRKSLRSNRVLAPTRWSHTVPRWSRKRQISGGESTESH